LNKQDLARKLTSRKFWAAVVGFVTATLVALNIDALTIERVVLLIGAISTLIAYIVGEGMVDASYKKRECECCEED